MRTHWSTSVQGATLEDCERQARQAFNDFTEDTKKWDADGIVLDVSPDVVTSTYGTIRQTVVSYSGSASTTIQTNA